MAKLPPINGGDAMSIHRCHNCGCSYDLEALIHHLKATGGCPGEQTISTACTYHFDACPYLDPDYRQRAGGWTDKTRPCVPIYRVAVTTNPRRPPGQQTVSYLTLSPEPPKPRTRAPRPPARPR